jgi:hypothetical protein
MPPDAKRFVVGQRAVGDLLGWQKGDRRSRHWNIREGHQSNAESVRCLKLDFGDGRCVRWGWNRIDITGDGSEGDGSCRSAGHPL